MTSEALLDLSSVLSSRARFRILQTLALLTEGMHLRELERQTSLGIRSVSVAVEALIQERVLKKNSEGIFYLNMDSPVASLLKGLFNYLREEKTRENAKRLSRRAQQVVRLSDEVSKLIHSARSKR